MARILFGIYPAWGHAAPTVALAQELAKRGHVVAYASHPALQKHIEDAGLDFIKDFQWGDIPVKAQEQLRRTGKMSDVCFKVCGGRVLRAFLDELDQGVADFRKLIRSWKPDLVINDIMFHVGAIAAEAEKIPHATSCPTILPSVITPGFPPLGMGLSPNSPKNMYWRVGHLAVMWMRNSSNRWLNRARRNCGLAPAFEPFTSISNYLGLVYTTEALEYNRPGLPGQIHYIGPSISNRRGDYDIPFQWDWLDGRPLIVVSLGTIFNGSKRFYDKIVEASQGQPWQVVAKISDHFRPEMWKDAPENIRFVHDLPQLALLKLASAMVSHAGVNSVTEALANGVPLVLAPANVDQPDCAQRVVDAGAGIRINLHRVPVERLRTAMHRILTEPSFRAGARKVADDFARCDGPKVGADLIERLVETRRPVIRAAGQGPTVYAVKK